MCGRIALSRGFRRVVSWPTNTRKRRLKRDPQDSKTNKKLFSAENMLTPCEDLAITPLDELEDRIETQRLGKRNKLAKDFFAINGRVVRLGLM